MKRLLNYLPMHFSIGLILGICFQFYFKFWSFSFYLLVFLFAFLLLIFIVVHKKIPRTLIGFFLFIFLGVSAVFINDKSNSNNYYQKYNLENSFATLKITKVLKSGNYHDKFEAHVVQIDSFKTVGKILLNLKKDSVKPNLQVDDLMYVKSAFTTLLPPLNPHQFNYKKYLHQKGIHQQIFLEAYNYKIIEKRSNSLLGMASKFRTKIQIALQKQHFPKDVYGVINALLLGQRQDISKELISDYSKAGAIHVLAVSGLHVGIILLILSWLLKPLESLKHGKIIKVVCLIFLLWTFAFIAGLSASVVRAVTMFSFVTFGMLGKKKNIVEFSLLSSFFLLLIVNPMFLFDVGFQLSYLAVFGIIWVQPRLYSIWGSKFRLIDFFWRLFTVSIAAQIGVLPLTIYYFHQFPGLFLLSNLIIIPVLGVILLGGILIILLTVLNILPKFLAITYSFIISKMNLFVQWISHQESFLLKDISLSFLMMLVLYVFIFSIILVFIKQNFKRVIFFLFCVIGLQGVLLYESFSSSKKESLLVFHKSRISILGKRNADSLIVYHNKVHHQIEKEKLLNSYKVGEKVHLNFKNQFPKILKLNNQHLLFVDSLGIYQLENLKSPIVILQYSPKINLERLIKYLKPIQIVADGSNYKSYVKRWKKTSNTLKIPFHYTGQQGAFFLKK